jgi:hypothetical protein
VAKVVITIEDKGDDEVTLRYETNPKFDTADPSQNTVAQWVAIVAIKAAKEAALEAAAASENDE